MSRTEPAVVHKGGLDMQVCVPEDWIDEQVLAFANTRNPCGTEHGWHIRREGDEALRGDPERAVCRRDEGFVHLMLDA